MRGVQKVRRSVQWAREWFVVVVTLTGILAGCDSLPFYSTEVVFAFENGTDASICYYLSPNNAASAKCVRELDPQSNSDWGRGCGSGTKDEVESNPITVILAIKQDGREIYNRTASCGEWQDTDRTFVIEQDGDEFIVTDSLSDATLEN